MSLDLLCLSHPDAGYKNGGSGVFTNCPTNNCGMPLYPGVVEQGVRGLEGWLNGQYRIDSLVAEAGQSRVYAATRRNIENPLDMSTSKVAVKAIRMDNISFAFDPAELQKALELFKSEAELLTKLNHPNIVKLFGHQCYDAHRAYTVMEFVEGKTLEQLAQELWAQGRRIDYSDLIGYAVQVCDVLEYIHSQTDGSGRILVYRDLSPDNIMVQPNDNVKLLDFGIAQFSSGQTKHTARGKESYAPPEQYNGRAEPRSDQYSLAATLHVLITGVPAMVPFQFDPISKSRADAPGHLEIALQKALSYDPNVRFNTISDFKQALTKNQPVQGMFTPATTGIHCIANWQQTSSGVVFPRGLNFKFSPGKNATYSTYAKGLAGYNLGCSKDLSCVGAQLKVQVGGSDFYRPMTVFETLQAIVQRPELLESYKDTISGIAYKKNHNDRFKIAPICAELLNLLKNPNFSDEYINLNQSGRSYDAYLGREFFRNAGKYDTVLSEDEAACHEVWLFLANNNQRLIRDVHKLIKLNYNCDKSMGIWLLSNTSEDQSRALCVGDDSWNYDFYCRYSLGGYARFVR